VRQLATRVEKEVDLQERLRRTGHLFRKSEVKFLAPVPDPVMILSCGANSRTHVAEMGTKIPERPVAFIKNSGSVIGPGADIMLPKGHDRMVDWEIEFSGVIGRDCHQVTPEEALDFVAGYTLIIDVSARDWAVNFPALHGMEAISAWDDNLLGKQFPTFCPMGPLIATKDEVPRPENTTYKLSVNGVVKQNACSDDLIFSLAQLISHYSQRYRFQPGDIVTTGSPPGVGFARKPPEFLKPGDTVTISAAGIGTMSNTIVAAS
jgi:2-keto-4-pentenoate hydratase/2-oxohepta-3-ene-1,7-dioic acid hydratase in catechol pathway